MRTTIRDQGLLRALRPVDVLAYLRSAGWSKQADIGDRASLWVLETTEANEDALVPVRRDAGDFAIRMGELLGALERVEKRAQEDIYRDIQSTSADLVRVRTLHPQSSDGTLPIDAAVGFVEQARDLIAAAACAAVEPSAYWSKRRPKQASEFMNRVRMGQTEQGSYVLTILSPVAPALGLEKCLEAPFERQVTATLTKALQAALRAAREAAELADLEPFRRAVPEGVSANLCDALSGLGQISPEHGFEVSVSWSRSRPVEGEARTTVRLTSDYVPLFQEASRLFKETAPVEDFLLTGMVVTLDRKPDSPSGAVTISTVVDGKPRLVVVELAGNEYSEAIRAHQESIPVSCAGELGKEGKSLRLRAPHGFRLLESE